MNNEIIYDLWSLGILIMILINTWLLYRTSTKLKKIENAINRLKKFTTGE